MAHAKVPILFELTEREPDGSACFACGEVAWLRAYDLVARLGKARTPVTAGTLCQSCAEMFEARDDPMSDSLS